MFHVLVFTFIVLLAPYDLYVIIFLLSLGN